MNNFDVRHEIIECARSMLSNGLVQGTGGNFSMRVQDGFLITPSGMDYRTLVESDIPKLSFECEVIEGKRKPSVEMRLHSYIYKARPDVNAVIHTHSVYATAFATLRRSLPVLTDNQAILFGGEIQTAEYAPIGTELLARNAVNALADGNAVLLANHGSLCTGKTLSEVSQKCEMLEIFAKIFFLAQSAGGGIPLTKSEAEFEYANIAQNYGQK